ncbi:hypothetical protein AYI68_g7154 [Smittium mucronatum]|uniref:Uncharacterized protein n=1 Tax=Smittium mucronatum TaxID=133383 RepID=A0A1R0GPJ0_9FUNG|nr:hypothetical protein AYI68_g7154 [Smittium mucronatum]
MFEDTKTKPKELTALVLQLMRYREPKIDENGTFITPIIPVTELTKTTRRHYCVPKNHLYGLNSTTAKRFILNCYEQVEYHAAPDPNCACPSYTTDRLLSTQKD